MNQRMNLPVLLTALLMLGTMHGSHAESEKMAPEEWTGIKIGEKAPDFTLKDQDNKERSLNEFLKKGKTAVVFYRSASWCPYCKNQLIQLQKDLKKIEEEGGLQIIAISYDKTVVLKRFAQQNEITFPLLSDEGSETIDAWGIRNKDAAGKGRIDGIPHPGTYIIDEEGIVRAKLFLEEYQVRHSSEALIEKSRAIQ